MKEIPQKTSGQQPDCQNRLVLQIISDFGILTSLYSSVFIQAYTTLTYITVLIISLHSSCKEDTQCEIHNLYFM